MRAHPIKLPNKINPTAKEKKPNVTKPRRPTLKVDDSTTPTRLSEAVDSIVNI